ncbi:hypothetical protein Sp245p_16345 (plasmid) [Azospirillum baldaniorum]|uniref:Uncharacterized protein n=1 Tax=Azospirillum baldaniorum TaxID=1064539 RepID=A0A9P1NNG5_9PROT|nr:hypothetical protein [Azospirillum baldaniorum]AWJ91415.1 hypothetical protein Sp245p_16345 [Azospirillum baldaniorum]TWA70711.1 hypothetical protein FBZ84_102261 [Azospirillum baldaniorum]TWA83729.1 hypothetical protein FBZ85_101478 [Azospirillum brasilense]CCC99703.1 conserved protein of unknown function [Azospirillum baldaniorum]
MGKKHPTARDDAYAVGGAFTGIGSGGEATPRGKFNVSIWGAFVATVALERSFDGGTTWLNCTRPDGTANAFTAPASLVCDEPETGVLYRLICSSYTSGTVNWRISQ